jgi:hypothetical protein
MSSKPDAKLDIIHFRPELPKNAVIKKAEYQGFSDVSKYMNHLIKNDGSSSKLTDSEKLDSLIFKADKIIKLVGEK